MKKSLFTLAACAALTLGAAFVSSCSSDEIENITPAPVEETLPDGRIVVSGRVDAKVNDYEQTRAGSTYAWENADRLYISINVPGTDTYVSVVAKYSSTFEKWSFVINENDMAKVATDGTAYVYFFQKAAKADDDGATLNGASVIYRDFSAKYAYNKSTKEFTLASTLQPYYSRVRFVGTKDQKVTVSNVKYYTSYNVSTASFTEDEYSTELTASTAKDEAKGAYYTDYLYGLLKSTSVILELANTDAYQRTFTSTELPDGASGWLDMPDENYVPTGWAKSEGTLMRKVKWSTSVTEEQKEVITKIIKNMVLVKGGVFHLGYIGSSNYTDYHTYVKLSDYYICKYELTQKEYKTLYTTNSSWSTSYGYGDNYPAYAITWTNCNSLISNLNAYTGLTFSLPTEAQWEYAARDGQKSKNYVYAGTSSALTNYAWYRDNSGSKVHEVGLKQPNQLGLYDMSGNVSEWCYDYYNYSGYNSFNYSSGSEYMSEYGQSVHTDPYYHNSNGSKVYRGGGYSSSESYLYNYYRDYGSYSGYAYDLGMRLVCKKP